MRLLSPEGRITMSNLLEQWNEHIVRGNQLSRELEDIEDILEKSKGADICFSSGANGAVFIRVLSAEKMQALRVNVVLEIIKTRNDKTVELEKLMGLRKPATINPEFEAAVQEMENQGNKQADPVEEKLSEILQEEAKRIEELPVPLKPSEILEQHVAEIEKMYKVDMTTVGAIAEKYRVKKTDVNTFLAKHKLFRTTRKEDGFLDAKVQARQSKG
jgi:hypothetical protein